MTLPTDTLLTPRQFVTETATRTNAINLRKLALLGVMHAADGGAALLRHPDGRVARLVVGEHVGKWRIGAIGDTHVVLIRNGEGATLHLPGTPTDDASSPRPRARPAAA